MKERIKTLTALLSILLVACMSLTLTACGDDDYEPETTQTYEWGFGTLQVSTPDFLSDMNKITDAFKSALGATGDATTVTKKGAAEKTDAEVREACQKAFDSLKDEVWQGNYIFFVTNVTSENAVAAHTFFADDNNFANIEYFELNGLRYAYDPGSSTVKVVENHHRYSGSIEIPDRVTYKGEEYPVTLINHAAFESCNNLTSVTIPESVTDIGMLAFMNCGFLESVTLPNSLKVIGESAFFMCSGLNELTIPSGVIKKDAFYYCNHLLTLSIGKGVTKIEENAFRRDSKIMHIMCYSETPAQCSASSFDSSIYDTCILEVPNSAVEAYSKAEVWKNFKIIRGSYLLR